MTDAPRNPDPRKSTQIFICGKKGSGKTELAKVLFDSYPYDRILVDPNGDIERPEEAEDLEPPIPSRWPGYLFADDPERRRERRTLYYMPDFKDPQFAEDLDRVCGLAYSHRRTCLFVDEAHEAAPSTKTPPHMRRNLRQGRHHELTQIFATPRAKTVDPLMISNADWVYVFKLPNPDDRKRVAENTGIDPKVFDEGVHALGQYEYLRYDAGANGGEGEWKHYPALPLERLRPEPEDESPAELEEAPA